MDTFLVYALAAGCVGVAFFAFRFVRRELAALLEAADAHIAEVIDDVLGPIGVDTP